MGRTIKLADVARAAGVSQGTVSNVFNRPDLVSPELRERVEMAARELGYRGPDPRGRLLRAGRVGAIGVVTTNTLQGFLEDPYERRFVAGIAAGCDAQGSGLALVSAVNDEHAAWNIRSALVDGFILNCMLEGSRLVELAQQRGLPFVAVEHDPQPGIDTVGVDDRLGARLAADHLLALGHRRFAVVSLELLPDDRVGFVDEERAAKVRFAVPRLRLAGYREALAAAGAPPPQVFETTNRRTDAALALAAILERDPGITAILCMSDLLACGIVEAAAERGLRVPEDLSVVGFDDVEDAARLRPPLTTIRQPIEEKGLAAVRLVFDDDGRGCGRNLVMPLELVVRATTAPPR